MEDWSVWPIFSLQLVTVILFFFKKRATFLKLSPRVAILGLSLISCIAIAISLYHDSNTVLHLYF